MSREGADETATPTIVSPLGRRDFLRQAALGGTALALWPAAGCGWGRQPPVPAAPGVWVNDIHSRLNRTRVAEMTRPRSVEAVGEALRRARREGRAVSIAGGRHAMGGQQFGQDTLLLDMGALRRVLRLDAERGLVEVEAGIQWPELIDQLLAMQSGASRPWGIRQKQTGADRLSLGGSLAANAHGRSLASAPIVGDVESLTLIDARGELRRLSRTENRELFSLAIGGYGLFGVIASVELRLSPRHLVERVVEVIEIDELPQRFAERRAAGFTYGDFQYATEVSDASGLRMGVFSCYRPAAPGRATDPSRAELSEAQWLELLYLAHTDRRAAFAHYAKYYQSTSGQIYGSDTHQLSTYTDDYHEVLRPRLGPLATGTEMITEIYVPRDALLPFLATVRADFIEHDSQLIYGTVRLIERDEETFLAWAREPWACVIFNLHTQHDAPALAKTARDFRRLLERGIAHGGSYFLTYHRYASREQVLACYPQFPDFLRLKRKYDPEERFQSEWYRHYRAMFADLL